MSCIKIYEQITSSYDLLYEHITFDNSKNIIEVINVNKTR